MELYCARHRFATDVMQATGNLMTVMDVMGHEKMDTSRIYNHSALEQIREVMNKRNESVQCKHCHKIATIGRNGCWEIGC